MNLHISKRMVTVFAAILCVTGGILVSTIPNTTASASTAEETRAAAEVILAGLKDKNSDFKALRDPQNKYNLAGVQNVHMIGALTGEYSINQTKSKYSVGGTDLGVMITRGDTTYICFGDTFLEENQTELWRNNVMAYTTDGDYTDGLLFDGMILTNAKKQAVAKELFPGQKSSGTEIAKIPTGGIAIGDTMYLSYMSVREWLPADGAWACNHGGVVRSTDDGKHWQYMTELTWEEEYGFCQMYPVVHGDMVYVVGLSGGRFGPAKLMRVPVNAYEDKSAYEYLTDVLEDGSPVFTKGEEGMKNTYNILRPSVGEVSMMYSEYLQEWIITYLSGADIILRTAKNPWGPWSNAISIAPRSEYPICYGAFMNERYVSEDGSKVMFLMSMWAPVYNTVVMEMELVSHADMPR